jgi:hypothetical protein
MNSKIINIGLTDFRKNLDKCAKMVRQGYEFIVFKRSAPIFRVTKPNLNDWKDLVG